MAGFLSNLISRIFGSNEPDEDELPDDGGLGEFAKQLAKELEEEEKSGKRASVSANTVLSVQQGRHGSKTYLLDSRDFRKAIAQELRDSVAPVIEGILKTRCGDKGTGYMNVKHLYIFHVHRDDPIEEYNAAMDIIDDIGMRLLGDRYLKGDRKVHIPVAQVLPKDLFDLNGKFDFKKASKSVDWIRQVGAHGPASVDWESGDVRVAEGAPDWVPNEVTPIDKQLGNWETQQHRAQTQDRGDWQKQEHAAHKKDLGDWEKMEPKKQAESKKDWEQIERKSQPGEEKKWEKIENTPHEPTTEQAWTEVTPTSGTPSGEVEKKPEQKEESKKPEPKPDVKTEQPIRVHATNLQGLGIINVGFRPTWQASKQTINAYAACPYRKVNDAIFMGEQVYPDDMNPAAIQKIDEAIAAQAALHIQRTKQLEEKTVILAFHLSSLLVEQSSSPIKNLRDLDEAMRKSIWIEIVGLGSNASPNKINTAISNHKDKFEIFGTRFELGDLSRSLIERSQANFLSCDVDASNTHGLQMRSLGHDLPELLNMAKTFNKTTCTWGIKNPGDLTVAIQNGSAFINGQALAKELRRPGRIIEMPVSKILSH